MNCARSPGGDTVACAVRAAWTRQATGLAAFPDGGHAKVVRELAVVYRCAIANREISSWWQTDRPEAIVSAFSPWVGAWTDLGLDFSLRGNRHKTTQADGSGMIRLDYRLTPGGGVDSTIGNPIDGPQGDSDRLCEELIPPFAEQELESSRP